MTEAEIAPLLLPLEWQIAHPLEACGGQLRRLASVEDRFDNVGCEKDERQDAADITWVGAVAPCDVMDRGDDASSEISEPAMGLGLAIRTIGIARARAAITLANMAFNMTRWRWLNNRTATA